MLKVSHTGNTLTRGLDTEKGQNQSDTLTKIRDCSFINSISKNSQPFRLARLGVGWVVGTMELFEMKSLGKQVAVDYCKFHHLPFSKIEEIEAENPSLILKLYKLLSNLMAQRQEETIGQLATLHSIMSSPVR